MFTSLKKFRFYWFIHFKFHAIFNKKSFQNPTQRPLVQILVGIKIFSAKFQVFRFVHSKVPAIFKKNSFQSPIGLLVQISKNPGAHVKYFLMLHPSAKLGVSRIIHPEVLTILQENSFEGPIRPLVQILTNLGHVTDIFSCFNSMQNFRSLGTSIQQFQPYLR